MRIRPVRKLAPSLKLDLSSVTFTEDEILADLHYPERAPRRALRSL
jgi:hypothetical protein